MAEEKASSIWLRQDRAGRGPVPEHSRAEIAAAAVAIADSGGLAGVSMRRVAAAIGAGAASLYRYVDNRDQLLELMVDTASGEIDLSRPASGDWRADMVALAYELRGIYRRHPWMLDVAPGTSFGPSAVDYLEYGLALLHDLDVAPRAKMEAIAMLNGFAALASRTELAVGGSTVEWQAAQAEFLASVVAAGRHPHLAAAFADQAGAGAPTGENDLFERVLPRMLAGLLLADEET